ncbi:MAG UNVERIFIED_CONTAM: 50S ribosome-binding GTPase [Planctomycetaceae bacterium]
MPSPAPNVGKSSLLNWLAERLISVVDPTAGVTRDRVTWFMHERDRYFELIDTGGIGIVDSDDLSEDIERQIQAGIDEADLLLFVVDAKAAITPSGRTGGSSSAESGQANAVGCQQVRFIIVRRRGGHVSAAGERPLHDHQRQGQPRP